MGSPNNPKHPTEVFNKLTPASHHCQTGQSLLLRELIHTNNRPISSFLLLSASSNSQPSLSIFRFPSPLPFPGVACVHVCSAVSNSATPWTVALQAPLSMGFSRQEYWRGLPFPSPGDLSYPGIELGSPEAPALAGGFSPPGNLIFHQNIPVSPPGGQK